MSLEGNLKQLLVKWRYEASAMLQGGRSAWARHLIQCADELERVIKNGGWVSPIVPGYDWCRTCQQAVFHNQDGDPEWQHVDAVMDSHDVHLG